jgi:hypothetical protein
MHKRVALALFVSSTTTVFARPSNTTPTTPTVVITPRVSHAQVAPWIYRKGNLRLSIACAESQATPDEGLALSIDGLPQPAQRWATYTDSDGNDSPLWNASDTGYLLEPGRHHVEIDAPGCASSIFDVDAYPDHAQHVTGRLALTDWSLQGPVGAPNGFGVAFGAWLVPGPAGTSTNYFGQTATFDGAQTGDGGYLSFSHERRNVVSAFDLGFAATPITGTERGTSVFGNEPAQGFAGTAYMSMAQLRVGARLPLQDLAFMAGSGVGLEWWINSTALTGSQTSGLFAPDGIDASFYLPVWASATIKPTCNWGAQVTGQYDVHPSSMTTNDVQITAGILYQPSDACSEPAGVGVTMN